MLKITDSSGKVVGVLSDDATEPHMQDCPNLQGKMLNCNCKEKLEEVSKKERK